MEQMEEEETVAWKSWRVMELGDPLGMEVGYKGKQKAVRSGM